MNTPSNQGLSTPVILISGIICAFFILLGYLTVRHIYTNWSPSLANVDRLFKKKKYHEALTLIEKIEPGTHKRAPYLVEMGKIWLALTWEQENRNRWYTYGLDEQDWLKSIEAQKAEKSFKQALELEPKNLQAHFFLGVLYLEKGWFSAAESEFLSVLRQDKDHAETRVYLGVLYTKMKRFDLAEQELRNALGINPKETSAAKNLFYLFRFYWQRPDSAISWANRYLNMNPHNDFDISFIRKDLAELMQRYPEYKPAEPLTWKKPRRFKRR